MNTLAKWLPPSLTNGTEGNDLSGFISSRPFFWVNRLLMIRSKSLVVLTGKNRLLGTLIPIAPLKPSIAAPEAVSNWITLAPLSVVLLFTIISMCKLSSSITRSIALKLIHKLFVLKILLVLIKCRKKQFWYSLKLGLKSLTWIC